MCAGGSHVNVFDDDNGGDDDDDHDDDDDGDDDGHNGHSRDHDHDLYIQSARLFHQLLG